MNNITVSNIMTCDGLLEDLEKAIMDAKERGATQYHVHIQPSSNGPYVQMIEFIKVLTEREVLENKRAKMQSELDEIEDKISKLNVETKTD